MTIASSHDEQRFGDLPTAFIMVDDAGHETILAHWLECRQEAAVGCGRGRMQERMKDLRARLARAYVMLGRPARSRESIETIALVNGALAFVIGFPISLLLFWGHELEITGPWSIGWYAAIGGAFFAAVSFILGRVAVRPRTPGPQERHHPHHRAPATGTRLYWYDVAAISLAYASIALLGWLGIAQLLELSFIGAPVFPLPGALLVGVAFALTAYIAFLGGAALTAMSVSLDLAIFLVVGAFAAMLTSSDPDWWRDNLSALGMSSNQSSVAFNLTVIVSGIIVTTIARYATAGLPASTPQEIKRRNIVRAGLVLIGIFLACVGVFPVDRFFLVHNTVATGMAVVYGGLIIALPWLMPSLPRTFFALGYIYVVVIVVLAVFFATGYYNLTAVELVAAILIFSWIIVFLRVAGSVEQKGAPDAGQGAAAVESAAS